MLEKKNKNNNRTIVWNNFSESILIVKNLYQSHKMALWNHLVPNLVQLGAQERE